MSAGLHSRKAERLKQEPPAAYDKRRRLHKGRQLNAPLLGVSAAVALVLIASGYFWYRRQTGKLSGALEARAEALAGKQSWPQAAAYWQRYLWLEPDDFDARMKLVEAVGKYSVAPRDRNRYSVLLHETIGRAADHPEAQADLQVRAAENLLEMANFSPDYASHAYAAAMELLVPKKPSSWVADHPVEAAKLRRVRALAGSVLARDKGEITPESVAEDLAASVEQFADDLRVASVAAMFYRKHAETIGPHAANRADAFLDDYVTRHPDDADGYVTRYAYRVQWTASGAESPAELVERLRPDLDEALRIAPDHYEALIYRAGALALSDSTAAEEALRKAIKANPHDSRAYRALAQLQLGQKNVTGAISTLREAVESVGAGDIDIQALLANALIADDRPAEADEAIQQLDEAIQVRLAYFNTATRQQLQNVLLLLRAKSDIAADNLQAAVVPLRSIIASTRESSDEASQATTEAKRLLAEVMELLRYWDVAAMYWLELSAIPESGGGATRGGPFTGEAIRRAAEAFLNAGQYDRAIEQFDRYLPVDASERRPWSPAPEAWVAVMLAHLQKQLALAPGDRNWAEFEDALAKAKEVQPPPLKVTVAEFEYLTHAGLEDGGARALVLLTEAESRFADDPEFWHAAATAYHALHRKEDAERALAKYDVLETNPAARAKLRAVLAAKSGNLEEADEILKEAAEAAESPGDRLELEAARIALALIGNDAAYALKLSRSMIDAGQPDVQLLKIGLEAALAARDFELARQWEGDLAAADPADDYTVRYFRALRLLEQFDKLSPAERFEAGQLVSALRSLRPNSGDTTVLFARYAELTNNSAQAIDGYQRAIALGNRRPFAILRLATLLSSAGRHADAEVYLSQLAASGQSSLEQDSLAILTAFQQDDVAQAMAMATEAAEKHPEDVARQLLPANLLVQMKKFEEAEQAYRAALEKFPKDARVWLGLFSLLHGANRADDAAKLLDEFAIAVGDTPERHRVSAYAYTLLNNQERALEEAEAAARLEPTHVTGRLLLARLLTAVDRARAIAEYEEILAKLDKRNGEARRNLAILLATSGSEDDALRAMAMLESAADESGTPDALAANTARVMLMRNKGRTRADREAYLTKARQIMEAQVQARGSSASDAERRLLASLYEQEAWLRLDLPLLLAAREQYDELASRPGAPIDNAVVHTDFLLRQLVKPVELVFDSGADPDADPEAENRRRRERQAEWTNMREVFFEDAKSRIADLERASEQPELKSRSLFVLSTCRVRLLQATGQDEAVAAEMKRIKQELLPATENEVGKAQAWFTMANLYSSIGAHNEAELWYRRLTEIAPETFVLVVREMAAQGRADDAISACLNAAAQGRVQSQNVAALLAQLMSTDLVDSVATDRVEPVLAQALEDHGDDVNLLMAVAVLNVTRENDAEAIRYFRRVVELEPSNALALNNLATLLAEEPSQRAEALEIIQNALAASGRQPALLDTLGTIQLQAGQHSDAVESLEEAVANGGGDPRYYFHLAAAYLGLNDRAEAESNLTHARRLGLDKAILTQGDQELLRELDSRLGAEAAEGDEPPLESRLQRPSVAAPTFVFERLSRTAA